MIIERCPDCDTTDIEFNGDFWTCEHDHEFDATSSARARKTVEDLLFPGDKLGDRIKPCRDQGREI